MSAYVVSSIMESIYMFECTNIKSADKDEFNPSIVVAHFLQVVIVLFLRQMSSF